ncbi:MAG: hypothetical protein IJ751_04615 [Oscillospiraceae bacterium]|nr:hypothetical protein [Oscillospiraceae bacterium]
MKKVLISLLVLVSCLGLLALSGCGSSKSSGEQVAATLTLIDKDDAEYTYDIHFTDGATLREALFEAGLISEAEHGAMFVEDIDGHIANVEEDGCTWMPLDADKKQIMGTFDDITLHGGDVIYLQYYVVPDFD